MNKLPPLKLLFVSFVGLSLITALISIYLMSIKYKNDEVLFWVPSTPYTTDPAEMSFISHNLIFKSTFSPLLSRHDLGKYRGILAERWEHSSDQKEWGFFIRKGLTFSNGDQIDPSKIVASFNRLLLIMGANALKDPLFQFLLNDNGSLRISSEHDKIIFKFSKPIPKLLDIISASQYSIVHTSLFDQNGKWINPKGSISSGPYVISRWDESGITIKRRTDFNLPFFHENPLKNVKFVWSKIAKKETAQIIFAHSFNILPEDMSNRELFSGPVTGIAYVRCHSWKISRSICSSNSWLKQLRNEFYKVLTSSGLKISENFIPTTSESEKTNPNMGLINKRIIPAPFNFKSAKSQLNPYFGQYGPALQKAAENLRIKATEKDISNKDAVSENDPNLNSYEVDFSVRATEFDFSDLRKSLEDLYIDPLGTRLPDPGNLIKNELAKKDIEVDASKINNIVQMQATIWPLTHFSQSLIVKKNTYDLSRLNLMIVPIELQWIGFK